MVKKRTAFSMIELIFAIVIIAIAVMALPIMTQATGRGKENNLVQSAIFASAAKLNEITSYPWDENSKKDGDSSYSRVIWTSDNDCNASSTAYLRQGHIYGGDGFHRQCLEENYSIVQPTSPLGMEASDDGNYTDIDDFNDVSKPIYINNETDSDAVGSAEGYKTPYTMDINVSYAAFGSVTAESKNIKEINITIINPDTNLTILKVHTYSANIGEIDYYKKDLNATQTNGF